MWRKRSDLWNGVVQIRGAKEAAETSGFVAFFVIAISREEAARKLIVELLDRGWELLYFVNMQMASSIDDEAAEYLSPMAAAAERYGVAFSDFPEIRGPLQ